MKTNDTITGLLYLWQEGHIGPVEFLVQGYEWATDEFREEFVTDLEAHLEQLKQENEQKLLGKRSYCLGFEVSGVSEQEGSEVTSARIRAALLAHLNSLDDNQLLEAVSSPQKAPQE